MKNFFTTYLLWVVLALINSNALLAQYSNATLNGPWFVYTELLNPYSDHQSYLVFDGIGNITATSGSPSPITGTYNVNPNGTFSGILNITAGYPFSGQLTSATEGTLTLGTGFHKILNPGALQDKIDGRLSTQYQGGRYVTLYIDNQGKITSASGLMPPVAGNVYTELGKFLGHITTGETSPWKEFYISGNYSNDNFGGQIYLVSNNQGMSVTPLRRFSDPISDWRPQIIPVVATESVGAIKFVSETEGWISITPGGLLHTTDGGTTWVEKIVHPTDILSERTYIGSNLSFINASMGWVLKTIPQGTVVYKTSNSGTTWERNIISTNIGDFGFQLQFVDANNGWLSFDNKNTHIVTYKKTTDGGTTWIPSNGVGMFYYVDANNGWAISSPTNTIYKTTNGGANWTQIATDNTLGVVNKMIFTDLNNGWIVGEYGKILKTINGGINWITITNAGITSEYQNNSIYFINSSIGWIGSKFGVNAIVLHTTNGGENWITQNTTSNYPIYSIYFWDENNGWLTGSNLIARYSVTLDVKENVVNKFITIYPNPNNGTFYFSLKDSNTKVKAEIYNISGQKVYEASNFDILPQNEVNFAPQSKGIYLIKITDGLNSYSEKIMIQ
jgi:photosystem II stability/assembly factor-like uncharacterized protein